jgi:predicted ATPase
MWFQGDTFNVVQQIYLNRHKAEFVRTIIPQEHISNEEIAFSPPALQKSLWSNVLHGELGGHRLTSLPTNLFYNADLQTVVSAPKWTSEPPEPDGSRLTVQTQSFLPISRLYRNLPTSTGAKRLSDQELDSAFARALQAQWSEYYADISKEIARAQERGLANILGFFLAGEVDQSDTSEPPDEKEAFKRITGFLNRQPGFGHLLRSEKEFALLYAKKPALQNVIKQIEQVEKSIALISAPRERFRNVLESMFTGSKHLVFTDKEIKVKLSTNTEIGLSLLSSGEKQLIFIAFNALVASNHCLIIDEPELSMHIEWQKKLVATLRDLNPEMQLIMATHSPEIMADLPDGQIFRL